MHSSIGPLLLPYGLRKAISYRKERSQAPILHSGILFHQTRSFIFASAEAAMVKKAGHKKPPVLPAAQIIERQVLKRPSKKACMHRHIRWKPANRLQLPECGTAASWAELLHQPGFLLFLRFRPCDVSNRGIPQTTPCGPGSLRRRWEFQ